MKKIVLIAVILVPLFCFSQSSRYTDLKVEFTSPEDNSIVQSPQFIHVTFRVYNLGPDTIYETDTVRYALAHTFDANGALRKNPVGRLFVPGDSIEYRDSIWVNSTKTRTDFQVSFVRLVRMYGPDSGKFYLQEEFERDRANNRDRIRLFHKGSTGLTSVSKVNLRMHPNPVYFGKLNIQTDASSEVSGVVLFNQSGQRQNARLNIISRNELELDFEGLADGVYFVKINVDSSVITKKVILCRE